MSLYGGIGGLNVTLPKVDRYSPATKEAVTAASGGAIKIPEYDVAEGFSQTEDYYNTVGQYKNFLAEAQKRGIDPTIPQIGSEEGQLAYQLHNEFINDINRKGRQLKQAKGTQNRLIQGGYRMPIGDQLETGQDVGSFMQAAPAAMKRGALLPQVQSYTKAISSDRIQPEQIQQYEQLRDQQVASVEAMRPTLAKRYGEAQADEIIAENIAALNTPIPVRYPTEVELANLKLRQQGLDTQRMLAQSTMAMREDNANKTDDFEFGSTDEISYNDPNLPTDYQGGYTTVEGGSFYFDNDVDIIPTGNMFTTDGNKIDNPQSYNWKSDRFVVVEVADPNDRFSKQQNIAGRPVNANMKRDFPKMKTIKQGMFIAKGVNKKTGNQIIGYEPATSKDAINRGYSTAPRKKQAQESLTRVLSGTAKPKTAASEGIKDSLGILD